MKVLFTSDTHFGHGNIIKYCNRPFATVGDMDKTLIANWNSVVGKEDIVYHLGDFAFGRVTKEYVSQVAKQLNGKIRFIFGNHDALAREISWRFEYMKDYDEIEVEGQKIVLFHYGMRTWHHDLRGTWHLYGHSHNELPAYGKSLDIGVDCWNFTPVPFAQLKQKLDNMNMAKHPGFKDFKVND